MSNQEQIKSLKEYLDVITKINEAKGEHQYIYRGQKNKNWKINSSAMRRLKDEQTDEQTDLLSYIFTGYIHQIIDEIQLRYSNTYKGLTALECMAHLQHNRVATGLIDFTYNPFVALWFACEVCETDGKVFVIDTKTSPIEKIKNRKDLSQELQYFFNKDNLWHLWQPFIGNSNIDTQRITVQQSVFLFGAPEVPQNFIKKEILISGQYKNHLIRELRTMGISEQTLFSDLAGFFERNNVDSFYDKELAGDFYTSQNNYFQSGIFKYALGKYEEAIEDFDKAVKGYEKTVNNNTQLVEAYNNKGSAKIRLKQYEEAIKDFNKAINLDPQYAMAYYNRGIAKTELEQYEEAIKDYDKAINLDPQYAMAYNNRGFAKVKRGLYEEAIKDFNKTIKINAQLAEPYNNRGLDKARRGLYEEAIEDFNKAIKINPKSVHDHYYRWIALLCLSKWENAKTNLITAKNQGVDIVKLLQEEHKNITEFEKRFNIKLPADIKALLTYKSKD